MVLRLKLITLYKAIINFNEGTLRELYAGYTSWYTTSNMRRAPLSTLPAPNKWTPCWWPTRLCMAARLTRGTSSSSVKTTSIMFATIFNCASYQNGFKLNFFYSAKPKHVPVSKRKQCTKIAALFKNGKFLTMHFYEVNLIYVFFCKFKVINNQ